MGILEFFFGKKKTTSKSKPKAVDKKIKKPASKKSASKKPSLEYKFKRYDQFDDKSWSTMLTLRDQRYQMIKGCSRVIQHHGKDIMKFNDISGKTKIWYDWEGIKKYFNFLSEEEGWNNNDYSQEDYRKILNHTETAGACIFDFGVMDSQLLEQIACFLFCEISIEQLDQEFQLFLLRDTKKEIEILKKIHKKMGTEDKIDTYDNHLLNR